MATCEAVYLDSCLKYEGPPTDTFSGLDHLNGLIIAVWADGAYYGTVKVENGSITLNREASKVIAGLGYDSAAETMPVERQDMGSISGRGQRIAALIARVYQTLAGTMAISDGTPEPMYDISADNLQLKTGKVRRNLQGGMQDSLSIRFEQTVPAPMTVLSVVAEMEIL